MKRKHRRTDNNRIITAKPKQKKKASIKPKKAVATIKKQENIEPVLKIRLPQLKLLEEEINKTVIGQEKVVRSVCTKIYEGLCFPQLKSNILIVGKSGTGKTEILRQLAQNLNLPLTIEDATRYTEDGYVGANVTDMISNLIKEANGNLFLASRGIIFIDEIDKKAPRGEYNSEVNRAGVLKGLLKIIEGTVVRVPSPDRDPFEDLFNEETIKFDTSNIIFIFGGAFEGLEEIREKRLKNRKIGFTSAEANQIVKNNYLNTTFTKEDLIKYGLPAELVGRISSIYETRELQTQDLKKILDYSKKSEFRKYEKIFEMCGAELKYSEHLLELIAQEAKKSSTGARELNALVSHMFEKIMYDAFNDEQIGKYTKCVLEDEIVFDNTKYHWE